jgi:hypothetical protein
MPLKYTDFQNGQWYKINLSEESITYFEASKFDETIPANKSIGKYISGQCLTISPDGQFATKFLRLKLNWFTEATPISVTELLVELVSYIADEHNQDIGETSVNSVGQPPMVVRVKPNGWICLDAASFFDTNLKRFGIMAQVIHKATYELLISEVLVTDKGRHGVCLEIEVNKNA